MTTTTPHDPDEGRRVLQCACSRIREWTGREDAILAGWGARWKGDTRVWECPGCYVPAPPVEPEPPNLATPERVLTFANGRHREREQVRVDLARLLEVDPARGRAWTLDILQRFAYGKGATPKEWRAFAKKHGFYRRKDEWLVSRRAAS